MTLSSADQLIEAYAQVGSVNAYLLKKLESVLARFHAHGIEVMLLKGADLIPRLYGVLGLRPMTDIDLLVRTKDLPLIDRLVKELGYRPSIDGNPAYVDAENICSLDLITDLWYLDDIEAIWQRAVRRTLGTVPVKAMQANDLLIYLTAYVVVYRGYFSASFAQDVALLVRKEAIEWPYILDEASRCHLRLPLYHGLTYTAGHGHADIPKQVLGHLAPMGLAEKWQGFLIQRLVTEQRVAGLSYFLLFVTQPGWRRWKWLARALFPPQAFFRYRYGERAVAHPILTRLARPFSLLAQALQLSVRIFVLLMATLDKQTREAEPKSDRGQ